MCITETLFLPDFGLSEIWVSTLVTLTIFIGQSIGGIHEMNDVIRMVLVCVSGVLPKRFLSYRFLYVQRTRRFESSPPQMFGADPLVSFEYKKIEGTRERCLRFFGFFG